MNPYIELLGITDIMSDSEEKTPTVSPDQDETGGTVSSTKKMDIGMQTGLSEEEKDAQYKKDYAEGVLGLLEEIRSMLVDPLGLSEEEKDAQYKKDAEGIFGLLEEIRSIVVCLVYSGRLHS